LNISPVFRFAAFGPPGSRAGGRGAHGCLGLRSCFWPFTFMPQKDEGAGDVDARIRTRDDPDQEGKGKIIGAFPLAPLHNAAFQVQAEKSTGTSSRLKFPASSGKLIPFACFG